MNHRIERVQLIYYRFPVPKPVTSRIGRFLARQSLIVRVESSDGVFGWGEIWCNFPDCGGEHRMKLAAETLVPWVLGQQFESVEPLMAEARAAMRLIALQCNEPGPVDQILAGLDCALWDLLARSRNEPLAVTLGASSLRPLPAYASGINATDAIGEAELARAKGFRAFKLKIGFEQDHQNLEAMQSFLSPSDKFMVDVNQGWDFVTARQRLEAMADMPLDWVEEPLPADVGGDTLALLSTGTSVPLAGGENVTRREDFAALIARRTYRVIQPDVAKWGGLTWCREVARKALANGLRYCPHFLGGGIGLLHSAHLLTAVGGDGMLEVDNNENPLRDVMVEPLLPDADGQVHLKDRPGLGIEPDLHAIAEWQAGHIELRR
ncbi:MAG: mandelate racemase/muconate lactonizing enzyme family protein [Pseudomonadota bacterium]